jgi:carbamoyl-phosphate synthase large subunit
MGTFKTIFKIMIELIDGNFSKMNCLFLGAGNRVSMAERFIEEGFDVFSYEIDQQVPISNVANVVVGKLWKDINIEIDIIETIKNKNIDIVIPFQDEATIICSKIKNKTDAIIFTSDEKSALICYDKKKFEEYMECNFPMYYPSYIKDKECIIKPINGFNSRGIRRTFDVTKTNTEIIQRYIEGKEYSCDCYFFNGKFIDGVSRIRLQTNGGEVSISKTEYNKKMLDICKEVGERLFFNGVICFQFRLEKHTNNLFMFEINARFGGGSILSIEAGLNFIKLIKKDYFDYKYYYNVGSWKNNFLMKRASREFFYENCN